MELFFVVLFIIFHICLLSKMHFNAFCSKDRHSINILRPLVPKNVFSYFSTKTYVVGTQKNRLIEMVLLSTQNMLELMGLK